MFNVLFHVTFCFNNYSNVNYLILRHLWTTSHTLFHWSHIVRYVAVIMSAITKIALSKKRYLDKKDASQLYMKEYRESNRNAIRESQKQYYKENKDAKKMIVQ